MHSLGATFIFLIYNGNLGDNTGENIAIDVPWTYNAELSGIARNKRDRIKRLVTMGTSLVTIFAHLETGVSEKTLENFIF